MTISSYSSAIVDAMLGWLKGLANWVLRLFNLAGSTGGSPLLWLSHNWLKLLILLMIIGVAADILVWLFKWRPHWVWFRKLRVIVNDDRFFDESDIQQALDPDADEYLERNWDERDYVVASNTVSRAGRRPGTEARPTSGRRRSAKAPARQKKDGAETASTRRGERRRKPKAAEGEHREQRRSKTDKTRRRKSEPKPEIFEMEAERPGVTDYYEDEVFNVNSLPKTDESGQERAAKTSDRSEAGQA